jgi:transcription initiation factor TFIIIB Brf1 subunit/transcription initiation factor TFIIB
MKLSKCKICKGLFEPKYTPGQPVCGLFACIMEYKAIQEEKEWQKRKKELQVELYPKKQKSFLQNEINKLAKMIDAKFNYPCIDCDRPYGKQIDACHFHNKASHGYISFNLHNLHSGRSDCNQYSSEHKSNYYEGLIKRYSQEYANYVRNGLPLLPKENLTPMVIQEKTRLVRQIMREFDKYEIKDGMQGRDLLNEVIGLYQKVF